MSDCARRWFRDRGLPFTWAYVWECPTGGCQHQHIAVHVPRRFHEEFSEKVRDWVAAGADVGGYQDRAVKVDPQRTPSMTGLIRYLVKGADDETRTAYNVPDTYKYSAHQGAVEGKRSEVSRNLRDISWPDDGTGPAPDERIVVLALRAPQKPVQSPSRLVG